MTYKEKYQRLFRRCCKENGLTLYGTEGGDDSITPTIWYVYGYINIIRTAWLPILSQLLGEDLAIFFRKAYNIDLTDKDKVFLKQSIRNCEMLTGIRQLRQNYRSKNDRQTTRQQYEAWFNSEII